MSWIKRNLYFLIGTVVALALMGMAGWYLYSKWQLNNTLLEQLNAAYAELDRINGLNPHPGGGKVDNIKAAKEQRQELMDYIQKSRQHFAHIPHIPDSAKVTGQEFTAALRGTVDQLQHQATNSSVTLQQDYYFSFAAQKPKVTFAPGSLEPLSVQLGEIKAISEILFAAKINSLDNVRRERVSSDDSAGPGTDYLSEKSVTNDLSTGTFILSPYEFSFRCFSSELAGVLAGLASSPFGLVVKTINVEQAPASAVAEPLMPAMPVYQVMPTMDPARTREQEQARFQARYGLGPYGRGRYGGGPPERPIPQPVAPTIIATAPAPGKGGLPTVLDEKQLKVTLVLNVVKQVASK